MVSLCQQCLLLFSMTLVDLLSSNCSSMYSISLFLRSEVNLLLNVVHSSLLSLEGFSS